MSDVLVVAEHRRGELRDVSYELLTAGKELADATDGELHAAVISGPVEEYADKLDRPGVDQIHAVENGEEFNHGIYTQVAAQLANAVDAQYILAGNTVNGLDFAPALAERLGLPLVTDAVDIETDDGLSVVRELYGGKTEGTVDIDSERALLTIRPGEWPEADGTGDAAIEPFEADIDESAVRSTVTGFEEVRTGDVDISDADVLVSVGRGIEDEENIELIEELADAIGATVSASRPIVDNGWLPPDRQVGQSGKKVSPDIYIAIGISGAVQHVAGMKGSETIIAINDDPSAPIYDIADYGIVDDLFDVVPALTEQFGE
ncbi:electron transfer flavoprotein subunit alpha/FixB family protein [Halobacteriaceae archaeon SHR40]|uniref:electron transfer flavoprotein subunit alpha/FixB family protein n=1 Tax=Halovenus amylolytica TaxID=2500550 RepID=UPI000FE306BA